MADIEVSAQPAWSCADDESLGLIFSLLREDALQVGSGSKGKQAERSLSDADLALRLYTEELEKATMYVSDRRMTKSIQEAVHNDADELLECEQEERIARNDRQIAVARSREGAQGQTQIPTTTAPPATESGSEMLGVINGTENGEANTDAGVNEDIEMMSVDTEDHHESSSWAASRRPQIIPQRLCTACGNMIPFENLVRAPCQHDYCRGCLETLFQTAMLDESLFPPRCCRQVISVDVNRLFLSEDLVRQFENKYVEFSTTNRIYCHQPTCSTFIPPSTIKDGVALCPNCNIRTCITCKGATHEGDCPADEALQQVLEIARQERWQRCFQCSAMVELNTGCFHITCKCRAEFCYLCGAQWKTCGCVQWEEHRLYERAEEIYNRNHNPVNGNANLPVVNAQPVAQVVRERGIQTIMEHLRENHECDHDRWRSLQGEYECEECFEIMPQFIYECRQCSIMVCRWCRYNRL
ncbi:hypothetical protein F4680DRAFT_98806 [Xylaria scruposa]|nr:hypothetical protein F4680DRAFT_98806 [Xylaria scruposa]